MIEEYPEIVESGLEQEEQVLKLWAQLMETYGKKASPTVMRESYRFAVAHPRQVKIYVAQREEKVLGTASLHLGHFSTWNNNWYGHVEDLIVHPQERCRGVASSLLTHIAGVARKEKLSRLELHTMTDNKIARAMYEKLGFRTSSVIYELPLE